MSRAAVIELQLERSLSVVIKHDVTIISCLHYVSDWCNRFNSSNPIFALIDKYLQNYSVVSLFPLPSFLIWLNIPEKFLYFLPDMRHPVVSADLMLLVWLGLPRQSEGANSWQPMGGLDTQAEQSSSASLRDCMTQPSLEQLRVATSGSSPQSMWENSQQTADSRQLLLSDICLSGLRHLQPSLWPGSQSSVSSHFSDCQISTRAGVGKLVSTHFTQSTIKW